MELAVQPCGDSLAGCRSSEQAAFICEQHSQVKLLAMSMPAEQVSPLNCFHGAIGPSR